MSITGHQIGQTENPNLKEFGMFISERQMGQTENPNMGIIQVKLNERNFLAWSRAEKMSLDGKYSLGYIGEKVKKSILV